jgi:hypothetical protein
MTTAKEVIGILAKVERAGLYVRDVVVLASVIHNPGECVHDHVKRLGIKNRSSLQSCHRRLLKLALVEDRREREAPAVPSRLYATDKGLNLWQDVVTPV